MRVSEQEESRNARHGRVRDENAALTAEVEDLTLDVEAASAAAGRLRADIETRMYATVFERSAWQHDIGEHKGSDFPYEFCPRCEMEHPKGQRAELRATIAERDATIARVKAVADMWAGFGDKEGFRTLKEFGVADIRAALETEP